MSRSCSSSDMAGTSTPYERPGAAAPGEIRRHHSHGDHSANAHPRHASLANPATTRYEPTGPGMYVTGTPTACLIERLRRHVGCPLRARQRTVTRDGTRRAHEITRECDVPQPDRTVTVGRGQGPAVRAERQPGQAVVVGGHRRADLLLSGDIPQPGRTVVAGCGQERAVRAERYSLHILAVGGHRRADRLLAGDVPQARGAVVAAGGQDPSIRAERYVAFRRQSFVASRESQDPRLGHERSDTQMSSADARS
jgi:hypothetical protein